MKLFLAAVTLTMASLSLAAEEQPFKELDKLSEQEIAAIKADFVAQNGEDWNNSSLRVHPFTGLIQSARRSPSGAPLKTERDDAIEKTRDFLLANRDRLGLEYWAIKSWLKYEFLPSVLSNVTVTSTLPRYYEEYAGFPDFNYHVDILVSVAKDGVESFVARSTRLTRVEGLETEPAIAFNDQSIMDKLIGREMTYFDEAGKKRVAGTVTALDVRPLGLAIKDHLTDAGKLWVGLVWRYHVVLDGLIWELQFSAVTGELVLEQPMFAT